MLVNIDGFSSSSWANLFSSFVVPYVISSDVLVIGFFSDSAALIDREDLDGPELVRLVPSAGISVSASCWEYEGGMKMSFNEKPTSV